MYTPTSGEPPLCNTGSGSTVSVETGGFQDPCEQEGIEMREITEEQVQVVMLLVDPNDPLAWAREIAVDNLCILGWERTDAKVVVDRAISAFTITEAGPARP